MSEPKRDNLGDVVETKRCEVEVTRTAETIPSQYRGELSYTTGPCGKPLPCADHPVQVKWPYKEPRFCGTTLWVRMPEGYSQPIGVCRLQRGHEGECAAVPPNGQPLIQTIHRCAKDQEIAELKQRIRDRDSKIEGLETEIANLRMVVRAGIIPDY